MQLSMGGGSLSLNWEKHTGHWATGPGAGWGLRILRPAARTKASGSSMYRWINKSTFHLQWISRCSARSRSRLRVPATCWTVRCISCLTSSRVIVRPMESSTASSTPSSGCCGGTIRPPRLQREIYIKTSLCGCGPGNRWLSGMGILTLNSRPRQNLQTFPHSQSCLFRENL